MVVVGQLEEGLEVHDGTDYPSRKYIIVWPILTEHADKMKCLSTWSHPAAALKRREEGRATFEAADPASGSICLLNGSGSNYF